MGREGKQLHPGLLPKLAIYNQVKVTYVLGSETHEQEPEEEGEAEGSADAGQQRQRGGVE